MSLPLLALTMKAVQTVQLVTVWPLFLRIGFLAFFCSLVADSLSAAARQQAQVEAEDARAAAAAAARLQRKRSREEQAVLVEEMLPRATGREARLEDRAARRAERREREASPEMMREKDVLGGGDDFQTR